MSSNVHLTLELPFPYCIWTADMREVLTCVFSHLRLCGSSFPVKKNCLSLKTQCVLCLQNTVTCDIISTWPCFCKNIIGIPIKNANICLKGIFRCKFNPCYNTSRNRVGPLLKRSVLQSTSSRSYSILRNDRNTKQSIHCIVVVQSFLRLTKLRKLAVC